MAVLETKHGKVGLQGIQLSSFYFWQISLVILGGHYKLGRMFIFWMDGKVGYVYLLHADFRSMVFLYGTIVYYILLTVFFGCLVIR